MSLYISGPMAGYPQHNFPAFQHAKDVLTDQGYDVFSPHDVDHGTTSEWTDFLRRDLALMVEKCDGIVLLKGWPQSRGARLELATALGLDWPAFYFDGAVLHRMNRGDALPAPAIDVSHLERQRAWSRSTFGPDARTLGVLDHIREELHEVEAAPFDIEEWADVLILAFDGAWRAGHEPAEIIAAIKAKQERNESRIWPDWRTQSPDHKIKALKEQSR